MTGEIINNNLIYIKYLHEILTLTTQIITTHLTDKAILTEVAVDDEIFNVFTTFSANEKGKYITICKVYMADAMTWSTSHIWHASSNDTVNAALDHVTVTKMLLHKKHAEWNPELFYVNRPFEKAEKLIFKDYAIDKNSFNSRFTEKLLEESIGYESFDKAKPSFINKIKKYIAAPIAVLIMFSLYSMIALE